MGSLETAEFYHQRMIKGEVEPESKLKKNIWKYIYIFFKNINR